jgi:hypothetical protein
MEYPFGIFFSTFGITYPHALGWNRAILTLLSEVLGGCQPGFLLKTGIENRF